RDDLLSLPRRADAFVHDHAADALQFPRATPALSLERSHERHPLARHRAAPHPHRQRVRRRRADGRPIALREQPFPRRTAPVVAQIIDVVADVLPRSAVAETAHFSNAIALTLTNPAEVQAHARANLIEPPHPLNRRDPGA